MGWGIICWIGYQYLRRHWHIDICLLCMASRIDLLDWCTYVFLIHNAEWSRIRVITCHPQAWVRWTSTIWTYALQMTYDEQMNHCANGITDKKLYIQHRPLAEQIQMTNEAMNTYNCSPVQLSNGRDKAPTYPNYNYKYNQKSTRRMLAPDKSGAHQLLSWIYNRCLMRMPVVLCSCPAFIEMQRRWP